ncbi:DUF4012 domain-containing protein [Candidatus Beckwithbacteria bacterium]|nr:DUF4012 domain-containing protein [Candidatus Beckwithbacteria bacterium]
MSRKKVFFIGFISIVGVVALYVLTVVVLGIWFLKNLENGSLDKAANQAKILQIATVWTQKTPIGFAPFTTIYQISNISLELKKVKDSSETFFSNVLDNPEAQNETAWRALSQATTTLLNKFEEMQHILTDPTIRFLASITGKEKNLNALTQKLTELETYQGTIQSFMQIAPQFLGFWEPKKYTVLLQNNREIRPTGGFIGSYGQLTFQKARLTNYLVQDIYVPDGAIAGHVNPPEPIQEAFGQGWWRLRDSNWDPNFAKASETMTWFFEKGGVDPGDGIIGLNLEVLEDVVDILGPIKVADYGQEITGDNIYSIAQYEAERDFFPGSTQKKDFLQALSKQLFFAASHASADQLVQILDVIAKHLKQKNIQFYFKDQTLQAWARAQGWSGELKLPKDDRVSSDYLFFVEANLGANKANCCIMRGATQIVTQQEKAYQVSVDYLVENHSIAANPQPPKFWGGNYKNYLRILLPAQAKLPQVQVDGQAIAAADLSRKVRIDEGLQELGFFVPVSFQQQSTVSLSYVLPKNQNYPYQLTVVKQSGIPGFWYSVELIENGKTMQAKRWLDQDQVFTFN